MSSHEQEVLAKGPVYGSGSECNDRLDRCSRAAAARSAVWCRRGDRSAEAVIMSNADGRFAASEPSRSALDIPTYESRLSRWEGGEGPRLEGIPDFGEGHQFPRGTGPDGLCSGPGHHLHLHP